MATNSKNTKSTNKYNKGEKVIVETVKGLEIGTVSFGNFLISRKNLVEPLKGITRRATQDDLEKEKKLIDIVKEYDPSAFIIVNETKYVHNGFIK